MKKSFYETHPPLKTNLQIKVNKRTQTSLIPHWHELLELIYIISGSASFMINAKSFYATAGDIVIINSADIHSFSAPNSITYYCIQIYPSFLWDIDISAIHLKNLVQHDLQISKYINSIYTKFQEDEAVSKMKVNSYLYSLLAYLTEKYTNFNASLNTSNTHTNLQRMTDILDYISSHYSEPISTTTLAKMFFLSENYFCRFFKSVTGKTFVNYINEYRIEKSLALLLNPQNSISQIALSVGFDDSNYFSRIFKKVMHQTPTQYRKRYFDKDYS